MSVVYTCECGEYQFFIGSSLGYELHPLNWLECSLVDELETNQIFYRRKFNGTLKFGGRGLKADFDYFWTIEQATPCDEMTFLIYKDAALYWEGYFSTSNGSFDLDDCTFEVTPLVTDDYTEILDGADIQYNILNSGISKVTTTYDNSETVVNYTRNYMLVDVIEWLATQVLGYAAIVDSTFFEDANNPVTLTTNRYNYLTIAQKSDIKRPTSSNPATTGMMSLSEIFYILRSMNLYWDLDTDGDIRIEHISYWPETPGIDIRTQKIARGTNKYKYTKETMYKYEMFSWMEAGIVEFYGYPIWYDSGCINHEVKANTSEYQTNVTTDIEYIRDCVTDPVNESLISDNGWVVLANENRTGNLYIWFNVGVIVNTALIANADMGWAWLHKNFFKHDRQLITGYMNNLLTTFYTSKKNKQQECSIMLCETFDPTEHITTELGETYLGGLKGKVGRAQIKPYGQIDLTLLYGSTDNVNPGITYGKYIQIIEVQTDDSCDYFAFCNQAADVQLTINIEIVVADADSDTCSVNDDIVIAAGAYKGSVTIPWCATMLTPNPPYCIDITNVTGPGGGWTVFLDRDFDAYCT